MPRYRFPMLLLIAVAPAPALPALAATATFTKIADNTTTPGDFMAPFNADSGPVVNDAGVAAFLTLIPVPGDVGQNSVYAGSGGPITTVSQGFSSTESPDINNAGVVAFWGYSAVNTAGIYLRSGTAAGAGTGPLAPIITAGGRFVSARGPHLSANGYLTFTGDRTTAGPGGTGAYRTTTAGGPITTIVEDPNVANSAGAGPVNNAGTVLYSTYDATSGVSSIKTSDGVTVTDYGGTSLNILQSADINNSGAVNITSVLAVTKFNGPSSTTVVAQAGFGTPFSALNSYSGDMFSGTGIGDDGTVAFGALLYAGGGGIFVGPDPVNDKIIADGDPLFGSTLTHFFFNGGISDDGHHIAFAYQLANGTTGVAVATVPEPSAAAAAMLLAAAFAVSRRRRASAAHRI